MLIFGELWSGERGLEGLEPLPLPPETKEYIETNYSKNYDALSSFTLGEAVSTLKAYCSKNIDFFEKKSYQNTYLVSIFYLFK